MSPFKVIIIGSGLSGSLLANGLAKNNIDFVVYERDPEQSRREGYQIRIGENALIGMRSCLDAEQLSLVVKNIGTNVKVPILYDGGFKKFLDLNRLPTYSKSVPIDRVVLREIFVQPVLQLGKIRHDKKFTTYEIIREGHRDLVRVAFDDGSTDTCDLLIGADGNRSKVNDLLGLKNIKALEGLTAFLTKTDLPLTVYNDVDQEVLTSPVVTLQDRKLMYFCAYLPKMSKTTYETVDSAKFDTESSSCMLSLCWPSDLTPTFDAMNLEQRWNSVMDIFKDWSPKHQQIFQLCRGRDMFLLSPRVGVEPPKAWRREVASADNPAAGNPHVWLMGDAIHPMIPNRGQGGQQAMRDTADAIPQILKLAAKAMTPEGLQFQDFQIACDDYEKIMIPRAFEWVRKSGGDNYVPFDLSKALHRLGFRIVSRFLVPAAWVWHWAVSWFTRRKIHDDAPEFD